MQLIQSFNSRVTVQGQTIKLRNHRNEEKTSPRKKQLQKKHNRIDVVNGAAGGEAADSSVPNPSAVAEATEVPGRGAADTGETSGAPPAAVPVPVPASVIAKHTQALRRRIAQLAPMKVLDVSEYIPETGRGARVIPKPTARDLTRQTVPHLPVVARTADKLQAVLALLGYNADGSGQSQ
jgi:hypothetical protein